MVNIGINIHEVSSKKVKFFKISEGREISLPYEMTSRFRPEILVKSSSSRTSTALGVNPTCLLLISPCFNVILIILFTFCAHIEFLQKQLACEVHCTSMRYILMIISFVPRLRGTLEKHGIEQSGMFCRTDLKQIRTDSKMDSHDSKMKHEVLDCSLKCWNLVVEQVVC